jgi:hypothetical protein
VGERQEAHLAIGMLVNLGILADIGAIGSHDAGTNTRGGRPRSGVRMSALHCGS